MAGDIEEPPFSFSFQADSLHSGSISFGRFEAESLSWERRSSFSHNRYLEEVEKYSVPGSVTEKKAYFEAHFKKKALLSQSSSECQNGTEYQTSDNDVSDNMHSREESKYFDEGSHFSYFDKSPDGSEYDGDSEVMDCERVNMDISYFETQVKPALGSADVIVDSVPEHAQPGESVPEHAQPGETHETETRNLLQINAEPETQVKENLNVEAANLDVISKAIDQSPVSHTPGKDDSTTSEHQRNPSLKVRAASESKHMKGGLNSQVGVTQVHRSMSSEASKDSAKKPIRRERESSLRAKPEKQSAQNTAPMTRSVHRISKSEDSESSKTKIIHQNQRIGKETRAKKAVESQPSTSTRVVPRERQIATRSKQTVSSTKPGMKQSAAVFSFRSDERAERRKELEEKMHAKEAEINQIHAKTQQKTEAEIKQFRRSLNFKATPMPSFYHGSDRNKAVSSNTKSIKARSKSSIPGAGASEKSPSSKARDNQGLSSSETAKTIDPPQASGVTNLPSTAPSGISATSSTPAANGNCPPQVEMNYKVVGEKEQEMEMANSQKDVVSDGSKVTKSHRVEGVRKVRNGRSSNGMVRKDMKGVGMGSGSRMGHLAVGVAS